MVNTIKVLKRKDASSVIVAVVAALIITPLLTSLVGDLSRWISGQSTSGLGWKVQYLLPVVTAALSFIALDILVWLYVMAHDMMSK